MVVETRQRKKKEPKVDSAKKEKSAKKAKAPSKKEKAPAKKSTKSRNNPAEERSPKKAEFDPKEVEMEGLPPAAGVSGRRSLKEKDPAEDESLNERPPLKKAKILESKDVSVQNDGGEESEKEEEKEEDSDGEESEEKEEKKKEDSDGEESEEEEEKVEESDGEEEKENNGEDPSSEGEQSDEEDSEEAGGGGEAVGEAVTTNSPNWSHALVVVSDFSKDKETADENSVQKLGKLCRTRENYVELGKTM